MLHLYNRATMARAVTLDLDPHLHQLLKARIDCLTTADFDITDDTEFVVVQPGDSEADIMRHIGFSPFIEPINGARLGGCGFHPFWDWLGDHTGWFEMIVTFGSTFAYVLFIHDAEGTLPELRTMCRRYAGSSK